MIEKYINSPRIAIYENGDQIKFDENKEIEWRFDEMKFPNSS
jgi:hypothetical protein